jgi:hypothetical protein
LLQLATIKHTNIRDLHVLAVLTRHVRKKSALARTASAQMPNRVWNNGPLERRTLEYVLLDGLQLQISVEFDFHQLFARYETLLPNLINRIEENQSLQ